MYLSHFSMQQRLTQHWKSGLLELKTNKQQQQKKQSCTQIVGWCSEGKVSSRIGINSFIPFTLLGTTISIYIPREVTFC